MDWIGRTVRKKFGRHDIFTVTVKDVDDHDGFDGHRLFQVVYAYNDGDDKWMEVDELASILQPIENEESTVDVVSTCLLLIL